jgi:hypothetical protein
VAADLAPGVVKSQAVNKVNALPIMKSLPPGVSNKPLAAIRSGSRRC